VGFWVLGLSGLSGLSGYWALAFGHLGTRALGSLAFGLMCSRADELSGTWSLGMLGSRALGLMGSRALGILGSWLMTSRVMGIWTLGPALGLSGT
jgi:hypothetical protein